MGDQPSYDLKRFVPPGPVANAWIHDHSRISFIMGPIGSGKTTCAIFKRIWHAHSMPVCNDGVIRSKWVVVRDSFRTLEKTTLASWRQWFPYDYPGSDWQGGNDRPAVHTLRIQSKRGVVEIVTEFAALGAHRIEEILRGWEGDGAWMNEADTMEVGAKVYLASRLRPFQGGLLTDEEARANMPRQLLGDFNAPDTDNWIYQDFVEAGTPAKHGFVAPGGHRLFVQPGGMDPAAENVVVAGKRRLPTGYYEDLIDQNKARPWWVNRMVHNRFGPNQDGKPVYACFDPSRHMAAKVLEPAPGLPIIVGLDAGLSPAAVVIQPMPTGQIRVLDELVPGHGYGPTRFAELLFALLADRYAAVPRLTIYADPAAFMGGDTLGGELTWVETVGRLLGVPIRQPAGGSNEIGLRLEAVTSSLMTTIDGTTPGLVVSPACKLLRKGFVSDYKFAKVRVGNTDRFTEVPDKNDYSHPHDALQYAVLGWKGRAGVVAAKTSGLFGEGGRRRDPWVDRPKSKEWFDVLR